MPLYFTVLIYNSPSFPIALCLCVPLQWTVGVAEVHEKEHLVWCWGREGWQNRRVQVPSCCWFVSPTTQCSTHQLAQQSNCIREKLNQFAAILRDSVTCAWHSILSLIIYIYYLLYINVTFRISQIYLNPYINNLNCSRNHAVYKQ